MKNLIIILYPYKFRKFDFYRFEISKLRKKNDVIIFDLIDIFYPHFKQAYKDGNFKCKYLKKIHSTLELFEKLKLFLNTNKKTKKILVLNFIRNDTFKGFRINNFLYKNFEAMNFLNPGVSTFADSLRNRKINIFYKLLILFKRRKETLNKIKGNLINLLVYFFQKDPKYFFVAGKKCYQKIQEKFGKKKTIIIKGSSWDFSKIFFKIKTKRLIKKKYCVYLDAPGPKFLSDSYLLKQKHHETVSFSYPSLKNFFDIMEKKLNIEVVIAPHPKTKIKNNSSLFGFRKVIPDKTHKLIKNSDFVMTRSSTSLTYGVYYNKPIILFYTNEVFLKEPYWNTINIAKSLNINAININKLDKLNFNNFNKFDKKIYLKYLYNYCSFKNIKQSNFEIINEMIK